VCQWLQLPKGSGALSLCVRRKMGVLLGTREARETSESCHGAGIPAHRYGALRALAHLQTGRGVDASLILAKPSLSLKRAFPCAYIAKSRPARFEYTPTGLAGVPDPSLSPMPSSGWPSASWNCACCVGGNAPVPGDCE
jgi:hypothetical protein